MPGVVVCCVSVVESFFVLYILLEDNVVGEFIFVVGLVVNTFVSPGLVLPDVVSLTFITEVVLPDILLVPSYLVDPVVDITFVVVVCSENLLV